MRGRRSQHVRQAEHQANVEIDPREQTASRSSFYKPHVVGWGDDPKRCIVTRNRALLLDPGPVLPGSPGRKWSHLYIRRNMAEPRNCLALNTAT